MSDLEQQINEIKSSTILSSFDDKITLLQWLKKLEQAIKESNIIYVDSLILNKNGNKISLTIKFTNGDTKTTNEVEFTQKYLHRLSASVNGTFGSNDLTFDVVTSSSTPLTNTNLFDLYNIIYANKGIIATGLCNSKIYNAKMIITNITTSVTSIVIEGINIENTGEGIVMRGDSVTITASDNYIINKDYVITL